MWKKFKSWWHMTNYNTAYFFMQDFVDAFYYIMQVMGSNGTSTNMEHQKITYKWAKKVLDQKFNYIYKNHFICKKLMFQIYNDYWYDLEDYNFKIIDKIKYNQNAKMLNLPF